MQPILFKLWILYLRANPNKVYDTTPHLNCFKSLYLKSIQTLDSTSQGQS